MFDKLAMSKPLITTLVKIAVALVIAGAVTWIVVAITALANGAIGFGGPQFITIDAGPFAAAVVGMTFASALVGVGTAIVVAAWVGALMNTARLDDKTWFVALLALGLVSLAWVAMIVYVLKGPDSTTVEARSAI